MALDWGTVRSKIGLGASIGKNGIMLMGEMKVSGR